MIGDMYLKQNTKYKIPDAIMQKTPFRAPNCLNTFMEDDLKISKVEYLSNRLLNQIFNLGLDDHIIFYKFFE